VIPIFPPHHGTRHAPEFVVQKAEESVVRFSTAGIDRISVPGRLPSRQLPVSGELLLTLPGEGHTPRFGRFSPDGRLLAVKYHQGGGQL
jgi:hypothetical protein